MDSGEETALCGNSIYGRDVDSLSWDFGMTDGRNFHKMTMYAYRAARLSQVSDSLSQPGNVRHRPSFWTIHQNDEFHQLLQSLQALGMTVLGMDHDYEFNTMFGAFPDMFGMSDDQIAAQPPYVQYFKCDGAIEKGEPGCVDHKFNLTYCPDRQARTSWHPGWKHHALNGHTLAFTVLEVVAQALQAMAQDEPANETLEQKQERLTNSVRQLNDEEQSDYDRMFQSPVPDNLLKYMDSTQWMGDNKDADVTAANKEKMKDIPFESFLKEPAFCHTALLPAEIRYKGILTENFAETGDVLDQVYEKANKQSRIQAAEKDGGAPFLNPQKPTQLLLNSKDDEWETCDEDLIHIDHKDYYYISSTEGWRTLTIPNEASKQYYTEYQAPNSKGWIFICPSRCKIWFVFWFVLFCLLCSYGSPADGDLS